MMHLNEHKVFSLSFTTNALVNQQQNKTFLRLLKVLEKKKGSVATSTERVTKKEMKQTCKNYKSDARMVSVPLLLSYTLILFV